MIMKAHNAVETRQHKTGAQLQPEDDSGQSSTGDLIASATT